jgi:hypothetical protein
MIGKSISDDRNTGTSRSQDDDAMSYAARLDLFQVYWKEGSRHELRFSKWLNKQDQRDRIRLQRIAAVTREIERDKLKTEREELIRRGVYRGRR